MCLVDCSVLFLLLSPPFHFPGFQCDLVSSIVQFFLWLHKLFNLVSNSAINGLLNFFPLIATMADWESENTMVFGVLALGDQVKC